MIIRFSGQNHPTRPPLGTQGAQRQSTHHRPIRRLASPDQAEHPWGIVRYRQAKHPNRQIVKEPKVIEAHLSAIALAKAEAWETVKTLKHILEKLGV